MNALARLAVTLICARRPLTNRSDVFLSAASDLPAGVLPGATVAFTDGLHTAAAAGAVIVAVAAALAAALLRPRPQPHTDDPDGET